MSGFLSAVILAAVGAAGWVLYRARAADPDVSMAEVADALIESARQHAAAAADYDPTAQTPETAADAHGDLAPEVQELVDDGVARWYDGGGHGSGYRTQPGATMDDRHTLARAECLRAHDLGLIPASALDECAAGLAASGALGWVYRHPGSRQGVRLYIGVHATDDDPDRVR